MLEMNHVRTYVSAISPFTADVGIRIDQRSCHANGCTSAQTNIVVCWESMSTRRTLSPQEEVHEADRKRCIHTYITCSVDSYCTSELTCDGQLITRPNL